MVRFAKLGFAVAIAAASAAPAFAFGGGCWGAPLPVAAFALPSLMALGAVGFGLAKKKN